MSRGRVKKLLGMTEEGKNRLKRSDGRVDKHLAEQIEKEDRKREEREEEVSKEEGQGHGREQRRDMEAPRMRGEAEPKPEKGADRGGGTPLQADEEDKPTDDLLDEAPEGKRMRMRDPLEDGSMFARTDDEDEDEGAREGEPSGKSRRLVKPSRKKGRQWKHWRNEMQGH